MTHLAVDDGGEGEVVKHVRAVPPGIRVAILALTLVVEPVHLIIINTHTGASWEFGG